MTSAILRGHDLAEPDRMHAARLMGSVFHGYVGLEMAGGFERSVPHAQEPGPGSSIPSTLCYGTGPHPDRTRAAPLEAVRRAEPRRK